jgi:succinyl-CoA synthetase beta subunit
VDLLEYQGKDLFRRYGVPTTPEGRVAHSAAEAETLAAEFGVPVMVKAQVLIGGRGKAGGVKYCKDPAAAREAAEKIIGLDIRGHVVRQVLVEPASDIATEYYLSILHDRVSKGYKVIFSTEGGIDIETVNRETPEKVVKVDLDPTTPFGLDEAHGILEQGGLEGQDLAGATELLVHLYTGFVDTDATLFEVNPLIRTADGRIIALDAKVSIDGNALFRHPDLAELGSSDADDPLERQAKEAGLQYVKLDGEVGVIGNGAGLVMATLDVVSQAGGRAANFLDVGGGADAERMAQALSLVLSDGRVKSVLINIFGGITRGDEVARGVLGALDRLGTIQQRLVVRLDGTNAEEGRALLTEANHPSVTPAARMLEAAERAVALADGSQQ